MKKFSEKMVAGLISGGIIFFATLVVLALLNLGNLGHPLFLLIALFSLITSLWFGLAGALGFWLSLLLERWFGPYLPWFWMIKAILVAASVGAFCLLSPLQLNSKASIFFSLTAFLGVWLGDLVARIIWGAQGRG